jgi:hypothetical protein
MQKAPIPGQASQTGSFLRSWSYNAITSLGFPYANAFYRRLSEMPNAAKLIGPSVDMETPLRHQLDLFGEKTAVLGCQR